ncbi:MAG: MBL fold metallo-hydrolase [Clostridia bacterium]|nr:MBL fold metallo-hydrolase [Clostridia bacterium]
MYKFCPLFSGSSGNATYIGTEHEGVLIDAGKNCKAIKEALAATGVEPEAVKALFITHEHTDHCSGMRVFANKYKIPVYSSEATLTILDQMGHLNGDFPVYSISDYADIGDFHIECHKTSHDVVDPHCYSILLPNLKKVSVVTDTGIITEETMDGIMGSETILLESNHDTGMLASGPYPYFLKRRIMGSQGHLSNEDSAETSVRLLKSGTRNIILAHLSKENNFPELAYNTTFARLTMEGATLGEDYTLTVANRDEPTPTEV